MRIKLTLYLNREDEDPKPEEGKKKKKRYCLWKRGKGNQVILLTLGALLSFLLQKFYTSSFEANGIARVQAYRIKYFVYTNDPFEDARLYT